MELCQLQKGLFVTVCLVLMVASMCCSARPTIEDVPTSGVFAEQWRTWKSSSGKSYLSKEEEALRYSIWKDNVNYIDQHNAEADKHGFTLKMNSFGDMVGGWRETAAVDRQSYVVQWR